MNRSVIRSIHWYKAISLCLALLVMALSVSPADAAKKKKKKKKKAQTSTSQPAKPSSAVKRANRYLEEFSTAKARTALEPEMEEDPSVFAVTSMGRVLTQEGSYDDAIAELERAAAMDKSDPDPQIFLGEALLLTGDDSRAGTAFRRAAERSESLLEADPESAAAHYQLGVAQQRRKKYGDAIASLEEARRLAPDEAMVVYQLGLTNAFKQNWQPAFDLLSEAIDMNSKIAYAYYYRGLSADKVGRGDLLVNDLHRFLELAPDAPEADRARRILSAATG